MNLGLDASVLVTWFVREDGHETTHRRFAIDAAWSAPSPLPVEMANTLRKKVHRGEFAAAGATAAGGRLAHLPIRHVETLDPVAAALARAARRDRPLDDGRAPAVAEAEGGRVVTADRRRPARAAVHGTSPAARAGALDAGAARG